MLEKSKTSVTLRQFNDPLESQLSDHRPVDKCKKLVYYASVYGRLGSEVPKKVRIGRSANENA